ncbi:hypothetical protein SDC9_174345 [bioreactor metagenome]|uniref:Uncharacterized protein n=1 Tax=bioreactor metagenome TaxID=1076179 RepID=A0A645GM16_9ZZZZ
MIPAVFFVLGRHNSLCFCIVVYHGFCQDFIGSLPFSICQLVIEESGHLIHIQINTGYIGKLYVAG